MSASELKDGGRLNKRNPHIGFFKHAPKTNSTFADKVLQGNFISPTEYKKELALRHSAFAGTFHLGPAKYRGMQYKYNRIISDRLGVDLIESSTLRKRLSTVEPGPLQNCVYLPVEKARAQDLNLRRAATSLVPLHSLSSLTTTNLQASQSMVSFANVQAPNTEKPLFAIETIGLGSTPPSYRGDSDFPSNPMVSLSLSSLNGTLGAVNGGLPSTATNRVPTPPLFSTSRTNTPLPATVQGPVVSATPAQAYPSMNSPSYLPMYSTSTSHPPNHLLPPPVHSQADSALYSTYDDPFNWAPTSPEPFVSGTDPASPMYPLEDPMYLPGAPFFDLYGTGLNVDNGVGGGSLGSGGGGTKSIGSASNVLTMVSFMQTSVVGINEKTTLFSNGAPTASVVLLGQKNALRLATPPSKTDSVNKLGGASNLENEVEKQANTGEQQGAKPEVIEEQRGADTNATNNSVSTSLATTMHSRTPPARTRAHTQPIFPYLDTSISLNSNIGMMTCGGTPTMAVHGLRSTSCSSQASATSATSALSAASPHSIHSIRPLDHYPSKWNDSPGLSLLSPDVNELSDLQDTTDLTDNGAKGDVVSVGVVSRGVEAFSTLAGILHASVPTPPHANFNIAISATNSTTAHAPAVRFTLPPPPTPPRLQIPPLAPVSHTLVHTPSSVSSTPTLVVDTINDSLTPSANNTTTSETLAEALDTDYHVPIVRQELSPFPMLARSPFASPASSPKARASASVWRSPRTMRAATVTTPFFTPTAIGDGLSVDVEQGVVGDSDGAEDMDESLGMVEVDGIGLPEGSQETSVDSATPMAQKQSASSAPINLAPDSGITVVTAPNAVVSAVGYHSKSQAPMSTTMALPLPYRSAGASSSTLENWILSGAWEQQWLHRLSWFQHQQLLHLQQQQQLQLEQLEQHAQAAIQSAMDTTLASNHMADPASSTPTRSDRQAQGIAASIPPIQANNATGAGIGTNVCAIKLPGELSPPPYTFSSTQLLSHSFSQMSLLHSLPSSQSFQQQQPAQPPVPLSLSVKIRAPQIASADTTPDELSPVFSLGSIDPTFGESTPTAIATATASTVTDNTSTTMRVQLTDGARQVPSEGFTDRSRAEADPNNGHTLKPGVHVLPSNPSLDFAFDIAFDLANDSSNAADPNTATAVKSVFAGDTWSRGAGFPLKQFLAASMGKSTDATTAVGNDAGDPQARALVAASNVNVGTGTTAIDSSQSSKPLPCTYILPTSLNVIHGDIATRWSMSTLLGDGGYAYVKLATLGTTTVSDGATGTDSNGTNDSNETSGTASTITGDTANGVNNGNAGETAEPSSESNKEKPGLQVAIKCIRKKYLHTDEEKHAVSREVSIQRSLPPHPHIIKLLEVWEDGPAEIEARLKKYQEEAEQRQQSEGQSGPETAVRRPPFWGPGRPVARVPFSGSVASTGAQPDTHGNVYLVMEACEHGDLASFIKRTGIRRFSEPQVRLLAEQLLDAVDFLHSRGVLHADIKPHNILLSLWERPDKKSTENDPGNRRSQHFRTASLQPAATLASGGVLHSFIRGVKLCDFGNARRSRDSRYYRITGDVSLVPWNSYTGTMGYTAPEILTRRPYGTPADIWSCGIVLYELLAGYSPFFPYTDCITTPVPFPAGPWSDGTLTPEAKHFIASLLQIDPAKRLSAHAARAHPWFSL